MVRKLKVSGIGVITSLLVSAAGASIIARLLLAGYIGDNAIGWLIKLCSFLSVLLGGIIASAGMNEISYMPLVIAVSYFGVLTICGLLLFEGVMREVPMTMAAIMGGGAMAYVIRQKGRGKRRKRK